MIAALPAAAENWIYARSPHFEMFSDSTRKESETILSDLELFRHVVIERMGIPVERNPRTTVVLFRNDKSFDLYKPRYDGKVASMGGVCVNAADSTVIALSSEYPTQYVRRIMFHEYVHQLVSAMGLNPPLWLNEGMAELFSTFKIQRKTYEIGAGDAYRAAKIAAHGAMSMALLFAVDNEDPEYRVPERQEMYYAQCWAFVHYCMFGGDKELRTRFASFTAALEQGAKEPIHELFEKHLQMNYSEMENRLERHVRGGSYFAPGFPLPKDWPGKNVTFTKADPLALQMALADLGARLNKSDEAIDTVRRLVVERPEDPRPQETLGAVLWTKDDHTAGVEHWRAAADLGSTNPYIYVVLAGERLQAIKPAEPLADWIADEALIEPRRWLDRALELEPGNVDAMRVSIWLEALAKKPVVANVTRVFQAVPRVRRKERILLPVALLQWRFGQVAQARETLALLTGELDEEDTLIRARLEAFLKDA